MIIRNQPTVSPFLLSNNGKNKMVSGKFGYAGSGASYCEPMTYTAAAAINCSAPDPTPTGNGQQFVVTNDGGGAGIYSLLGNTKWRSTTGDISLEILWDSSTDVTSGSFQIGIASTIAVGLVHLSYDIATGILKDEISSTTLATFSATQGTYRMGVKLNMATGTATYQDNHSTPHSGSLSVDASFDNSLPFYCFTAVLTPVSGVTTVSSNIGSASFALSQSSGTYCDYNNDMTVADYPFTSDLLDTINGYALDSAIDPTPSATGISLTAGNDSRIPTTGFPVNDFTITSRIQFNANANTSLIFENQYSAAADSFFFFISGTQTPRLERARFGLSSNEAVALPVTGALTGRTFDVTVTQSSTTGITLAMVEVGGSSYSETNTTTNAETIKNINPWTGYVSLAERSGGSFQININVKDWNIEFL